MTELSPAAQAVLDATAGTYGNYQFSARRQMLAGALRAVADQVVPEDYDPPTKNDEFTRGMVAGKTLRNMDVRTALYRLAAELEGQ